MNLTITTRGMDAIQRGFAAAPKETLRLLLAAMTQATKLVEREVTERMPRGATGLTVGSISSDAFSTSAGVLGVVGSSQPSAVFVELGTKPHMPPVAALVPWVQAVLGVNAKDAPGVAFLIARKIAIKGTEAKHPFENALIATQSQVIGMFETAADQIATVLAGRPGAAL
ncbi:hypothetical protein [Rhodoferax sp.]|uniref:hypothetical protein n=1 Tax=Rhodoferax sp. TaxID=50421 RepID=UPI00374D2FA4